MVKKLEKIFNCNSFWLVIDSEGKSVNPFPLASFSEVSSYGSEKKSEEELVEKTYSKLNEIQRGLVDAYSIGDETKIRIPNSEKFLSVKPISFYKIKA